MRRIIAFYLWLEINVTLQGRFLILSAANRIVTLLSQGVKTGSIRTESISWKYERDSSTVICSGNNGDNGTHFSSEHVRGGGTGYEKGTVKVLRWLHARC